MYTKIISGRLEYEPETTYGEGVCMGPWHLNKFRYKKHRYNHKARYPEDYCCPENPTNNRNDYYTNLFKGEGWEMPHICALEAPGFENNYTSTYDVSFNIRKKKVQRTYKVLKRDYMPSQDYMVNYGNHTNWGLKEAKRAEWEMDQPRMVRPFSSEYNSEYVCPPKELYRYPSLKATPKKGSSKLYLPNIQNVNLKMRQAVRFLVPETE